MRGVRMRDDDAVAVEVVPVCFELRVRRLARRAEHVAEGGCSLCSLVEYVHIEKAEGVAAFGHAGASRSVIVDVRISKIDLGHLLYSRRPSRVGFADCAPDDDGSARALFFMFTMPAGVRAEDSSNLLEEQYLNLSDSYDSCTMFQWQSFWLF